MVSAVLDVLFPLRCAGCGSGPWPFCEPCRVGLVELSPPGCARCGRPYEHPVGTCRECPPRPIHTARAPFLYHGPARSALRRLKFGGWRAVAEALAHAMVAVNQFSPDAVSWIPLSRARRAARGYDQARALARPVGRALGVPALPLLTRTRDTSPQARRSGGERRRAMEGAFRATGGPPPARVLLVDDVLTTGTTAAQCAEALAAAGARQVALLVAARAVPGRLPARCYTSPGSRLGLWLPGEEFPGSRCQSQAKRPT